MNYRSKILSYLNESSKDCHVHHIDGDRKNNHTSNLVFIPKDLHRKIHIHDIKMEDMNIDNVTISSLINISKFHFEDYKELGEYIETLKKAKIIYESQQEKILKLRNKKEEC